MDPKLLLTDQFNHALADYFYLIDKDYPEKGTLKLVGDRYGLQTEIRSVLYRGVSSNDKSNKRSARMLREPKSPLFIDGYNVLLTIMNYRLGRFVFVSTDTICRDAGWQFGKIVSEPVFFECISMLVNYLRRFTGLPVIIYLDASHSQSMKHCNILQSTAEHGTKIERVDSADQAILQHTEGTIATSDSELIDHSSLSVIDIPLIILKELYKAPIFNLKEKLASIINPQI
jgi:hypothetical protein